MKDWKVRDDGIIMLYGLPDIDIDIIQAFHPACPVIRITVRVIP